MTLIDNKTGRSVRVVATPEAMRRSQESEFIQYRKKGVPASQVDPKIGAPLIDQVLAEQVDVLFKVEPIKQAQVPPMPPHAFDTIICADCGEVTVERYARVKDGKRVCIPCADKA